MEHLNPRVTIQNASGPNWLLTFEHSWNVNESITFTVSVPKSDQPVAELIRTAIAEVSIRLERAAR